jgi:excisionase family DNA binding protein
MGDLLLVHEAARRLGVSESRVRRLIRRGRLLSIQIGRLGWRAIPAEAIEQFIRIRKAEEGGEHHGGDPGR